MTTSEPQPMLVPMAKAHAPTGEIIEHDRTQEKGNNDVEQFQHAIKHNVSRGIFRSLDFHPCNHPFFWINGVIPFFQR